MKKIMKLTDASEQTVKHWMSAQHGPETIFFLRLLTNSPVIRAFVMSLIEVSQDPAIASQTSEFPVPSMPMTPHPPGSRQERPPDDRLNDLTNVAITDPIDDALNERQRWFLARVDAGSRCRADDLSTHWSVSLKTARRDIAGLCSAGTVRYVCARKNGRYVL